VQTPQRVREAFGHLLVVRLTVLVAQRSSHSARRTVLVAQCSSHSARRTVLSAQRFGAIDACRVVVSFDQLKGVGEHNVRALDVWNHMNR